MPYDTSSDGVYSLGATRVAVPIGATAAIYMQPQAGQVGWMLSSSNGCTFELYSTGIGSSLLGLNFNTTLPLGTLAGFSAQGFMIGGTNAAPFAIPGPACFYMGSSGGTAVVSVLFMKGQGY